MNTANMLRGKLLGNASVFIQNYEGKKTLKPCYNMDMFKDKSL